MNEPVMRLGDVAWLLQSRGVTCELIGDANTPLSRVHTDTRSLQPGDFFVALRGERFDAHDLLYQLPGLGASAVLAERGLEQAKMSGVQVPDAKRALGELAAAWRMQFKLPLIVVTGSNGKTTVTQMIGSILRAFAGDLAVSTVGNLNNDIGVPLTLLRLRPSHRIAAVELGMNHPGEIAQLAGWAQPTVAVVNNAQREHQEFMRTVEAVALENGSVITALPSNGTAVFPTDDAYSAVWRRLSADRQRLCFSGSKFSAEVTGAAQWDDAAWRLTLATPQGSATALLKIAGRHNVKNALAATAASLAAGVPLDKVVEGLESFEAVAGRSRTLSVRVGSTIHTLIDDTYNANPDSVLAAVDTLCELPGPHLLILGDMGEVGDRGPEYHAEVCEYAASRGIESLLCIGALMRYGAAVFPGARHFGGIDALIQAATKQLPVHRSVLVKGSRFMRMEQVVRAIHTLSWVVPIEHRITAGGIHHAA